MLFTGGGRFIAISAANTPVCTATDPSAAWHLIASREDVATVAGPLHDRVLAADVDPADVGAEAEAGIAAAEDLVAWCESRGLPWLLRASGRPGGRHVLAVLRCDELADQWRALCAEVRDQHSVGLTPRRTLRLLSAPHRQGLPAPIMAGNLAVDDVPSPADGRPSTDTAQPGRRRRTARSSRAARRAGVVDRSAAEYGDALARSRAGWSSQAAWSAANVEGSKAREMGELEWRRWVWCRAVTVVAAEQGADEARAWRRFRGASGVRARQLGIVGWRSTYWRPALAEASLERPRRRRTTTDRSPTVVAGSIDEHQAHLHDEVERTRDALRTAADRALVVEGRRPQFAQSVAALLDALAEPIVAREGSISERALAEAARIARSTVQTVLRWLHQRGVVNRVRAWSNGSADCAAWNLGPATTQLTTEDRSRSTRWYTSPRTYGRANPARLRQTHSRERQLWRLRCELSAATETTGETYRSSQHPAARTLRSLYYQRKWWRSLTDEQRQTRRANRRALLGRMHHSSRSAWFDWLDRRNTFVAAAERTDQHHAVETDHALLAAAPRTVHLGLRDSEWRQRTGRAQHLAPGDEAALPWAA